MTLGCALAGCSTGRLTFCEVRYSRPVKSNQVTWQFKLTSHLIGLPATGQPASAHPTFDLHKTNQTSIKPLNVSDWSLEGFIWPCSLLNSAMKHWTWKQSISNLITVYRLCLIDRYSQKNRAIRFLILSSPRFRKSFNWKPFMGLWDAFPKTISWNLIRRLNIFESTSRKEHNASICCQRSSFLQLCFVQNMLFGDEWVAFSWITSFGVSDANCCCSKHLVALQPFQSI